ncbi:MAG: tyrosine-type recombinase/integrase [Butyribacter sp.]|nr:tyrosine-type recombinase/integrase [Butyribacter sp.]
MGKDIKGKELGVGISQRKDGLYSGRFVDKHGKRRQKYFKKLQECRQWIADATYQDMHSDIQNIGNMSLDAWFDIWLEMNKTSFRYNTIKVRKKRYENDIKPIIGHMLVTEIKTIHCQNVMLSIQGKYSKSTMDQTRSLMKILFDYAIDNEIITSNPVTRKVRSVGGKEEHSARVLTIQEQNKLISSLNGYNFRNQYVFVLNTGLRCGEMIALTWDDVDFEGKKIIINKTATVVSGDGNVIINPPKTKSSIRDVPLTNEALRILKEQKKRKIVNIENSKYVFVGSDGRLISNQNYSRTLAYICKKNGLSPISMHSLRHTFATRCIEAGMKPKTLQAILGHSNISMTMNKYVHTTADEKIKEMERIEHVFSSVI